MVPYTNPALEHPPDPAIPPFILGAIDYERLPLLAHTMIDDIVLPAYNDLVVRAQTSLARSAGLSLVFILTIEIFEQFEIAAERIGADNLGDPAARERRMAAHLRLLGSKQKVGDFIVRLAELRERGRRRKKEEGPLSDAADAVVIMGHEVPCNYEIEPSTNG